jgi:hypothetical protein
MLKNLCLLSCLTVLLLASAFSAEPRWKIYANARFGFMYHLSAHQEKTMRPMGDADRESFVPFREGDFDRLE